MKRSRFHSQSWWSQEGGLRFHSFSILYAPLCLRQPRARLRRTGLARCHRRHSIPGERARWRACWCERAFKCILTVGCIKQSVYSAPQLFLIQISTLLIVFVSSAKLGMLSKLHSTPILLPVSNPTHFSGFLVKIFLYFLHSFVPISYVYSCKTFWLHK